MTYPIRVFSAYECRFFHGACGGIFRRMYFENGSRDVSYDYLVLAAGATTNYFWLEKAARHAFGLKTLQEAIRIRNQVLRVFERPAARWTVSGAAF